MLSPSEVVAPDEVSAELERVLASPNFTGANQLAHFLRFVVEETLAGRGQSLKQYTIAVKALGRLTGFDPQTDTIVRVQAGRLRRALLVTGGTPDVAAIRAQHRELLLLQATGGARGFQSPVHG